MVKFDKREVILLFNEMKDMINHLDEDELKSRIASSNPLN